MTFQSLGSCSIFALVFPAFLLELLVDEHPGAVHLRIDFALAVAGAAAGTVDQALGAAGDGADGPVVVDDAGAAVGALLHEVHGALDVAQEQRVAAGDDVLVGGGARGLRTGAAGQDQEGVGLADRVLVLAQDALHVELVTAGVDDLGEDHLLAERFQLRPSSRPLPARRRSAWPWRTLRSRG